MLNHGARRLALILKHELDLDPHLKKNTTFVFSDGTRSSNLKRERDSCVCCLNARFAFGIEMRPLLLAQGSHLRLYHQ